MLILESEGGGWGRKRMKRVLNRLYKELLNRYEAIAYCEEELKAVVKTNEDCQRVQQHRGVGLFNGAVGLCPVGVDQFHGSWQLSAFMGLVFRKHSSGNREGLLGISKRGYLMLRTLLIHGARGLLRHVKNKADKKSLWSNARIEHRGMNRACVTLANKNGRII